MFNFFSKFSNVQKVFLNWGNRPIEELLRNYSPEKPNSDTSLLYPPFLKIVESLQQDLSNYGLNFYVFDALRSPGRQQWLWEQGRSVKGTSIVTNALPGQSFHNFGIAVDLVVDRYPGREGIQWTWDSPEYKVMERIIQEKYPTLVHGARWSIRDFPHIQLKIPCTLSTLKRVFDTAGGGEIGLYAVYSYLDKVI